MANIKNVIGRQIIDSRGNPTVEVDVILTNGIVGRASVPSGASTGEYEACELRDGNPSVYLGKGVLQAVKNVNTKVRKKIIGKDPQQQQKLDQLMLDLDGTPNKSNLGANAILGVSMALARAAAQDNKQPLWKYLANMAGNRKISFPLPMCNILNGGAHSDAPVDIQEFMVAPVGATNFSEGLRWSAEIFHALKTILKKKKLSTSVGDEGGFAPELKSTKAVLDSIIKAIELAGYKPRKQVKIALDVAASEFYNKKKAKYVFKKSTGKEYTSDQMVTFYKELCAKYPIYSIEDGLDENDWAGWKKLTRALGKRIQLVGDDLYVTNPERLSRGIEEKSGNAILIKVNQIGTLTETLEAISMAQDAGFGVVVSHRSGETEDTFIADLAVATDAGQIKTGSLSRTDRIAKYNQLLRIEEEVGSRAQIKKHRF